MQELDYFSVRKKIFQKVIVNDDFINSFNHALVVWARATDHIESSLKLKKPQNIREKIEINQGICLFFPNNVSYLQYNGIGSYMYVSENYEENSFFELDFVSFLRTVGNLVYKDCDIKIDVDYRKDKSGQILVANNFSR